MFTHCDFDFVSRGEFKSDLASGVGCSDYQHSAGRDGVWPAVINAMDLPEARIQVLRHRRDEGRLEGSRGNHDVVSLYLSLIGLSLIEMVVSKRDHLGVKGHRQLEFGCVRLEKVGNVVLAWVAVPPGGECHPWQVVVLRCREEFQRIPPLSPRVTNISASIDDLEALAAL
jgi:hypothetical protein